MQFGIYISMDLDHVVKVSANKRHVMMIDEEVKTYSNYSLFRATFDFGEQQRDDEAAVLPVFSLFKRKWNSRVKLIPNNSAAAPFTAQYSQSNAAAMSKNISQSPSYPARYPYSTMHSIAAPAKNILHLAQESR